MSTFCPKELIFVLVFRHSSPFRPLWLVLHFVTDITSWAFLSVTQDCVDPERAIDSEAQGEAEGESTSERGGP